MADVRIVIYDNGPIEINGPITLEDESGTQIPVEEGEQVFFCRCGQSGDKPFCDGTHDVCGFASKLTK